jgi:DNA-directed RNA polymerase beta subunit
VGDLKRVRGGCQQEQSVDAPSLLCGTQCMQMHNSLTACRCTVHSLHACRCTIPYAKDTIPLFIVFRAMGFVADKEILQHIVYDFSDVEMLDLLRPSIEEAVHVTSEAIALDWIGRRIADPFMPKAKRVAYARDVLQKELLPHIGIGEMMEPKKAYFLGYMVHRMLLVALGRQPGTDRDSYAVKRLRMAGPLMADLFRCVLFSCKHSTHTSYILAISALRALL